MTASLSQFIKKLSSRFSGKIIFWLFFCFFLFVILLNNSYRFLDPDLGWHLRVGEEIRRTLAVPVYNTYNYTHTGQWVDHEWLGNGLLSWAYANLGYGAVSIIFTGLALAAGLLILWHIRRRSPGVPIFLTASLFILGLAASLPSLGVRLQEIGFLFTPATMVAIYVYERTRNWQRIAWLVPVYFLWACLHASFLLGLALLALYLAWLIIRNQLPESLWGWGLEIRRWPLRDILPFGLVSAITAAATLLTPYGWRLYSFLGGYRDSFYQYHIQEWLAQHIFPLHYLQLSYLAVALSLVIIYLYHARENRLRIDPWDIVIFAIFFILAWRSRRHFPLFFAVTLPYLIVAARASFGSLHLSLGRLQGWLVYFTASSLGLAATILLVNAKFTSNPFHSFCGSYPCYAVQYLQDHPELDQQRLFNDYGWGGYLIYTLPDRLLFIDGRLPQEEFAGHTFLEEYYEFFREGSDIGAKLDQYQISLVLMPAQDKKIILRPWEKLLFGISDEELETHNRLRDWLDNSDWQVIYGDNVAVLYQRTR